MVKHDLGLPDEDGEESDVGRTGPDSGNIADTEDEAFESKNEPRVGLGTMEVAPGTMATEKPKAGILDQTVRTQKRSRREQEAVIPRIRRIDDTFPDRIP